MKRTDLVAIKAFGDLVIALTAVRAVPAEARSRYRLLVGAHLVPLVEAIGSPVTVEVLDHREQDVPAMYDVRRCGPSAAMRSAWRLRRLIRAAQPNQLLFDRLSARERWLAGGGAADQLPAAANIYLAYAKALGLVPAAPAPAPRQGAVGIFPGSRVAAKNLTRKIVRATMAAIERAGFTPCLLLLEGERPDLEVSGLAHQIVPRSLAAMIDAVTRCSCIISADSMPAHVAEQRGIPVHVISPIDNRYWLPQSAFMLDRWSLFDADIGSQVGLFLTAIQKEVHDYVA